jgi:hypothetical protein
MLTQLCADNKELTPVFALDSSGLRESQGRCEDESSRELD